VTISTLLVCDDTSKADSLQALIGSRPELRLTSSVDQATAQGRISTESPSLVWIELSPEPVKGLSLLGELREKFPAVQFLVSYQTLKADLVKSAMQLGAVEYIDPESAEQLLPDAIERVIHKLNEAVLGSSVNRARVVAAPTAPETPAVPDETYIPGAQASTRSVTGVRGKAAELSGAPGSMPWWLGPLLILCLVAAIVYLAMSQVHH
jgi:DNA-binding NtrC family response regulator